jgi:hypothetical protein
MDKLPVNVHPSVISFTLRMRQRLKFGPTEFGRFEGDPRFIGVNFVFSFAQPLISVIQ